MRVSESEPSRFHFVCPFERSESSLITEESDGLARIYHLRICRRDKRQYETPSQYLLSETKRLQHVSGMPLCPLLPILFEGVFCKMGLRYLEFTSSGSYRRLSGLNFATWERELEQRAL